MLATFVEDNGAPEPAVFAQADTQVLRGAVPMRRLVSGLAGPVRVPKVGYSVVGSVAVHMVNRILGPRTFNPSDRRSVRQNTSVVNATRKVSVFAPHVERGLTRVNRVPSLLDRFGVPKVTVFEMVNRPAFPMKEAGVRFVVNRFSEREYRDHRHGHSMHPSCVRCNKDWRLP